MQQNGWSSVEHLTKDFHLDRETNIARRILFDQYQTIIIFYILHSEQYTNCNAMFEAHVRCIPNIYLIWDLF